ncbi:hypothetical protein HMPREF1977_1220 [Capnocytophaga ochracea F0287]|uniref:Uncharacterized protein n=1 Tax=Capnocytophaga ochracea F0287 TaxID=873517 RepID=E4MS60_CAPOC|nr:hypothetical protein HMPREF1977_1220 [Capnocytophaga ochracea F0287]EJF43248.1 hypothetical protein HMPREF1319_0430 [Capnocytophaga ochracea str. Holt 25]
MEISKWGASYKLGLEEINFAKGASRTGKNFGKVYTAKETHLSYRKETEKFGRGEGGFLMKKGY